MSRVEDLLTDIRDLIANRGVDLKPSMPTANRGAETPLVMSTVIGQPESIVGKGPQFQGLTRFVTHHYTLGEVFVVAESIKPAALVSYGLEARVVGWAGGVADVIGVGFANTATGPFRVALPIGTAYDAISVDVRQIVNGLPSGATPQTDPALLGAILKASVEARIYR
jgi:hypothetical protein